jgi:hypothetical protein
MTFTWSDYPDDGLFIGGLPRTKNLKYQIEYQHQKEKCKARNLARYYAKKNKAA